MATRTSNGTDTDTQTQINASAAGDVVVVPNGSFTWTTGITCSKAIKIMGQSIGGVTITSQSNGSLVTLVPPAASSAVLEFCNLSFVCGGSVTGSTGHFVAVNYLSFPVTNGPVAIHDCTFTTPGATGQVLNSMLLISQNGTLVYNCTFNTGAVMTPAGQGSAGDQCIQFKNPATDIWQFADTMGLSGDPNGRQNTYIEDCTFLNNLTQALDFDDGSRTAVRHCTFNLAAVGSHGYDTSPFGGRHWELYNNTFIGDSGVTNLPNGWITMRTGTGVIANNVFGAISGSNWGTKTDIGWLSDGACQAKAGHCFTTIPIPRAVGQGWSGGSGSYSYPQAPALGSGYIEDPAYIFGNTTGTGNNLWGWNGAVDCANQLTLGFDSSHYIVQNTDFFVGTAKPGWSAFTYPHPLRAQLGGPSYSTTFPATENPLSESGKWTNGANAGLDWHNIRTVGGLALTTQTGSSSENQFADATAILTGDWGPVQRASAVLVGGNRGSGAIAEVELRLHSQISAHSCTGYEIIFRNIASGGYANIVRWNGALGNFTTLATGANYNGIPDGATILATIDATGLIIGYINGVEVMRATDTTFPTGNPGIGFDFINGNNDANWGFSSFSATASTGNGFAGGGGGVTQKATATLAVGLSGPGLGTKTTVLRKVTAGLK